MALYRFAELSVEMEPLYPLLKDRAAPYLFSESVAADISIRPTDEYLAYISRRYPRMNHENREYMTCGALFYHELLRFDGMMLHASAVACDDRAYLFTAPPGTGKSTHTGEWVRILGNRAFILNDDKPALRRIKGEIYACGTPFSGKTPLSVNRCLPVGGICLLMRGTENRIKRIPPREALPFLYGQTQNLLDKTRAEQLLDILAAIAGELPLYRMECTVGEAAARMAIEAMTPHRQDDH